MDAASLFEHLEAEGTLTSLEARLLHDHFVEGIGLKYLARDEYDDSGRYKSPRTAYTACHGTIRDGLKKVREWVAEIVPTNPVETA